MNNIMVYKLVTGEEIITSVQNEGADEIRAANPAVIIMQQTANGVGVGLMPFMPYASGEISIRKSALVSSGTPDTKMVNEYNRIFGSGIEVVPASALAGLQM
jgi:hypothetical protein